MRKPNGLGRKPTRKPISQDGNMAETTTTRVIDHRLRRPQLAHAARESKRWLWEGYLASGMVTLLTSQWKSGKSTLIALLISRMKDGGELAAVPVTPGKVAIVSEEGPDIWDERANLLDMGDHASYFCQLYKSKPTMDDWKELIDTMLGLRESEGLDLPVVDTLATFLPGHNENTAGIMMDCLLPLRALTRQGIGVLLVHHPRKGNYQPGQASRGSGALPGYVDILLEMGWAGSPDDAGNRRRWLRGFSRHSQTRRHVIIELNPEGTDYLLRGTLADEKTAACWDGTRWVLQGVDEPVTQREILDNWLEELEKPDIGTISRTLKMALADGRVCQTGKGLKNDLFRYWLPEREDDFHPGPRADQATLNRWHQRQIDKTLSEMALKVNSKAVGGQ
jgi:hypothetical protein